MRLIVKFTIVLLFISCSNKENNLNQYADYNLNFDGQKFEYPNNDFSILLPKNWKWKAPYKETDNDILGLFANSEPNKNGNKSILLLKKYRTSGKNIALKSEFDYLMKQMQNHSQIKDIVDFGSTDILNQESYFFHTKSESSSNGNSEIINFLIKGAEDGVFYNLTVSTPQTEGFNINMAVLIQSLKTLKIKS